MKVGILTYHWVANFGANLQALSTFCYLKNNGYDPIFINWIPDDLKEYYERNVPKEQFEAHKFFAQTNYDSISEVCKTTLDIANVINKYAIDTVAVGSDAVFSIKPFLSRIYIGRKGIKLLKLCSDSVFPNPFWGSFLDEVNDKVRIVSISASAQNSPYNMIKLPGEKKKYCNALRRFDVLTVRDIWTQNMVKFITKGTIIPQITPDPVFAFNYNVKPKCRNYVQKKLGIQGKYILISLPSVLSSNEWLLELENLFEKAGYTLVWLPKTNKSLDVPLKYQLRFPINPLDWYDAIKYSDGYIGELMHPILVSLHNAVPVYSFDTYGFKKNGVLNTLSSKIYQILDRYHLIETNYYNKLFNKKYPSALSVFSAIINFNKQSVKDEAHIMLEEYISMMKKVLNK